MDQKKIIIIASIGVLIVGLVVIGVVAYRSRTAMVEQAATGTPSPTAPTPTQGTLGSPPLPGKSPTAPASAPAPVNQNQGLPGVSDQTPDYTGGLDSDKDGLPDARERILGTDPHKADTDGDGYSDGDEVLKYGSDPLDPKSTPKTIEGHEKFGL